MSFLLRTTPNVARTSARTFSTSSTASSFAKMTMVGRLTATPELQATSTGKEIMRYGVATDSGRGDNKKTSFFNVTSFMPEGAARDFRLGLEKGTLVYIEGEASMSYYEDAEGKKRNSLSLIERELSVLAFRKPAEEGEAAAAAAGGQ